MNTSQQPQSNDDNEEFPLTSELIGTITGHQPAVLNSEQISRIKRMSKRIGSGCIVIAIRNGHLVSINQVEKYIFAVDPTEK